jgi:hypothetical protein
VTGATGRNSQGCLDNDRGADPRIRALQEPSVVRHPVVRQTLPSSTHRCLDNDRHADPADSCPGKTFSGAASGGPASATVSVPSLSGQRWLSDSLAPDSAGIPQWFGRALKRSRVGDAQEWLEWLEGRRCRRGGWSGSRVGDAAGVVGVFEWIEGRRCPRRWLEWIEGRRCRRRWLEWLEGRRCRRGGWSGSRVGDVAEVVGVARGSEMPPERGCSGLRRCGRGGSPRGAGGGRSGGPGAPRAPPGRARRPGATPRPSRAPRARACSPASPAAPGRIP